MSAIWGIIQKKEFDNEKLLVMKDAMASYMIDRVEEASVGKAYMACGHQHFTKEAINDVSPIYDEKLDILFTGDCYLYNRDDVVEMLEDSDASEKGDTELAFFMYKKYGENFVSYLRGSFAFAIYNNKSNEIKLFSDQFVQRYLAYYDCEDYFVFASTYKPILAVLGKEVKLNEKVIVQFYENMSALSFAIPRETVYDNIYHVDDARIVTIDLNKTGDFSEKIYWNPDKNIKKIKGLTDEEYKKLFLDTYTKSVTSQLRSNKNIGIMLSGGLDSASVAAIAAPYLRERNIDLFSYTTVPATTFKSTIDVMKVEDESFLIKEQVKWHPNIKPRYINGDKGNCMTDMQFFQHKFDMPVKPSINNINIDDMAKAIREDECSIVLTGSNGNSSVSYGTIKSFLSLCWTGGHKKKAIDEMFAYCKNNRISRKGYLKFWLSAFYKDKHNKKALALSNYLRKDLVKKYNLSQHAFEEKKQFGSSYYVTEKNKNNFMHISKQYIQKSFYYTQQSLGYGHIILDPTLTVEIVELVLALPNDCFMKDGVERRLIKGFMADMIPEAIISDEVGRGVQAADFDYRVRRDWKEVRDSVLDILGEPLLRDYLDGQMLDDLLESIKENEPNLDKRDIWDATLIGSLGYFLREHTY